MSASMNMIDSAPSWSASESSSFLATSMAEQPSRLTIRTPASSSCRRLCSQSNSIPIVVGHQYDEFVSAWRKFAGFGDLPLFEQSPAIGRTAIHYQSGLHGKAADSLTHRLLVVVVTHEDCLGELQSSEPKFGDNCLHITLPMNIHQIGFEPRLSRELQAAQGIPAHGNNALRCSQQRENESKGLAGNYRGAGRKRRLLVVWPWIDRHDEIVVVFAEQATALVPPTRRFVRRLTALGGRRSASNLSVSARCCIGGPATASAAGRRLGQDGPPKSFGHGNV